MKLVNVWGSHLPRELLDRLARVPPDKEYDAGPWRCVWWELDTGEAIRAGQLGELGASDVWSPGGYRRPSSPEGWEGLGFIGSCTPWGDFERVARQVCKRWKDSQQMSLF